MRRQIRATGDWPGPGDSAALGLLQQQSGRRTGFRVLLACRGLLADGPELFADLDRERPGRVSCAANDQPPASARVWSNAEAKATEREDGELDLVVADGVGDNKRYRLTRRIG